MHYIPRIITSFVQRQLKLGMSILLLGPRQTGKTTLIKAFIKPDAIFSFVKTEDRLRYESSPSVFWGELDAIIAQSKSKPLIFIDEIQKIPLFMDTIQYYIDENKAQFILSGSSARKLKHGSSVNLLPGRIIMLRMSPYTFCEIEKQTPLDTILRHGTLPIVHQIEKDKDKEAMLTTYVHGYLQDEIRAEGIVKNTGHFAAFLQIAASESGNPINFSKLSSDIGVADTTIQNYYQILDDCMIAHRINPITKSSSKRRLVKTPRYLFFDLGVRRVAAGEGYQLSPRALGERFEEWVGIELMNLIHATPYFYTLHYWRDRSGTEVDYVLDTKNDWIPIEVKYKASPNAHDAKYLIKFMHEYNISKGYIVCTAPRNIIICKDPYIEALPWQSLNKLLKKTEE